MKYSSKSLTHVGKVRSANEDSLGEAQTPNGNLFVVCDGMGGHVGGATASSIAIKSIIEFFQRDTYDNVIQAIDHSLSFANEQIYASALSNPELKGMGTTAVVLLIRGEECFIGHVGDSRIYLRSDGKLNRITKDHSFVQTLVDSGVIDDEDAEKHPNKNQILQALGIASSVKGTICQAPILPKKGDMFLLCSDGLNGMVTDRDLEKIMQEDNIAVTAENLITAALNGGGHDNITASLVLIEESTHSISRFVNFNPKPKMSDMSSTQQFGGISNSPVKKKSKLPYIIGGGVLLIGAGISAFLFLKKDVELPKDKKSHKYTLIDLEKGVNCIDIKEGDKVDCEKDTTIIIKCGTDKMEITMSNSFIQSVKPLEPEKDKVIVLKEKDAKAPVIKSINEMTRKEISSLKIGNPVKDIEGIYKRHGYVVTVKNKMVSKKELDDEKLDINILKTHTVEKGQGLAAIVKLYKAECPKLSEESIIEFNSNSKKLSVKQKENLSQGILDFKMKLEIPCE